MLAQTFQQTCDQTYGSKGNEKVPTHPLRKRQEPKSGEYADCFGKTTVGIDEEFVSDPLACPRTIFCIHVSARII